jgi:hypothetical protein
VLRMFALNRIRETTLSYFSGIHVSCHAQYLPIASCLSKHSTRNEEDCPIINYVIKVKEVRSLLKGSTTGNTKFL